MAQTTMDDTSPAITYLPTQEDWVFANMPGWFNDTLQYVPLHEPSVPRVDVFLYPQFHPATQWFQSSSQGLASDIHLSVSILGCPCTVH